MSNASRSIRRIADQVVTDSLDAAFNQVFAAAVERDPRGTWRAGTVVRSYLAAIEKRLAWLQTHSHL